MIFTYIKTYAKDNPYSPSLYIFESALVERVLKKIKAKRGFTPLMVTIRLFYKGLTAPASLSPLFVEVENRCFLPANYKRWEQHKVS